MSSCFLRCVAIFSSVIVSYLIPIGSLEAQRVAVLDATRSGREFNIFNGARFRGMREATLAIADGIVPLRTLLELDAGLHDVVLLHSGYSLQSPMLSPLSEDEQRKLREFVEEGGAAFVAAETYGGRDGLAASSLLAPFDVELAGLADDGYVEIADPDRHPVTQGQDTLRTDAPSWFTDLGPCAKPLVSLEPPGGALLAVIERDALAPGSGRVVLSTEGNWIVDSDANSQVLFFDEHEVLFENSLRWLIDGRDAAPSAGDCDEDWEPTPREGAFENCRRLGPPVSGSSWNYGASVTRDGLCLVFESGRAGGPGGSDIFMVTRDSVDARFGPAVPLGINWRFSDSEPNISPDGLKIYFSRTELDRWDPQGTGELFVATRTSRDEPFGEPTRLVIPGLPGAVAEAVATEDDLTLIVEVRGDHPNDLFEVTRDSVDEPFEEFRPLSELNTTDAFEIEPSISADGLTLFFGRNGFAVWWATRPARRDAGGAPVPFGTPRFVLDCPRGVGNRTRHDWAAAPFITPDWPAAGSKLYFTRFTCQTEGDSCGGDDIWVADWVPAETPAEVRFRRGDCNGDSQVNVADPVCILNWLFAGEAPPGCVAATNTNGDDGANVADATYLLNHLFAGGSAPLAPFPDCGPGTTPGDAKLGCANPPDCR